MEEIEVGKGTEDVTEKLIEPVPICPYAPKEEALIKATNDDPKSIRADSQSESKSYKLKDGEGGNDNPPTPQTNDDVSFLDELYNAISSAIGVSADNQYFCLMNPGTSIDKSQYSYDIDKGEEKPAHVIANESKLVNKLFDPAFVLASDNGRHLQTQYKTALDVLTPKLNSTLFEAKSLLRKVLMTPYPYNFGDGNDEILTLEQVYYRLYGKYVTAKKKWAELRNNTKEELRKQYKSDSAEDNAKRTDAYLKWYATIGESEQLAVEEKLGKVLSVFSPGDMEIINGILDSGAGREIAEAKQMLSNAEMLDPSGGKVYPVTLYPQNWFTLLNSSTLKGDLLDSPSAISQKLQQKVLERNNLQQNISKLLAIIPDKQEVIDYKNAYDAAKDSYEKAFTALGNEYANVTIDTLKTFVDVITAQDLPAGKTEPDESSIDSVPKSTTAKIFGIDIDKVDNLLDKIKKNITDTLSLQQALLKNERTLIDSASKLMNSENLKQFQPILDEYTQQLSVLDNDIATIKSQLNAAMKMYPDPINTDKTNPDNYVKDDVNTLVANSIPDGFQQVLITKSTSSIFKDEKNASSSSVSSTGMSFIFGGYSQQDEQSSAIHDELSKNSSVEIQVAMSVAKVNIEREWFEPGVFMLSKDMINTSSSKIAPSDSVGFSSGDKSQVEKRFQKMADCLFPSYPVAFVVAKDVSIRFTSGSALSTNLAKSVEDHSAKGGGFFIFSGSSAKTSSNKEASSSTRSTANSITVRFANPQILGYYLEAIPEDKSENFSNLKDGGQDYMSVITFIDKFKDMLEEMKADEKDRASMQKYSN